MPPGPPGAGDRGAGPAGRGAERCGAARPCPAGSRGGRGGGGRGGGGRRGAARRCRGAGAGLGRSGGGSRYAVYESHVGEHVPLERIRRGPDGRFVVETDAQPQGSCTGEPEQEPPEPYLQLPAKEEEQEEEEEEEEPVWHKGVLLRPRPAGQPRRAASYRHGRYFGYGGGSSSSPVDEAGAALCIVNISPVASAATLPYGTAEEPRGSPGPCPSAASALWDSLPLQGSPQPPLGPPSPAPSLGRSRPPAPSGILQYLSLPFFKEMSVDGDWPPAEEPGEPPASQPEPPSSQPQPAASPSPTPPGARGSPQRSGRTLCPDCFDTCANVTSPPATATAFLRPPSLPLGPAKASLPGSPAWPGSPSPQPPSPPPQRQRGRTEAVPSAGTAEPGWAPARPPEPAPLEKLLRGSLTSQSSGRGSVSFLRPPSLAPSLGTPLRDGGGWHGGGSAAPVEESRVRTEPALGGAGKRRNTSVDENYEWDADFALESDILEALQLYRSGHPARPVSTIALRDLERQRPGGGGGSSGDGSSPVSSVSAEVLAAVVAGAPPDRGSRRRREAAQQRRQRLGTRGCCAERFELATLL